MESDIELHLLLLQDDPAYRDRRDALLRYARDHPGRADWRELLRFELSPANDPYELCHHMDVLTLYPGHGTFAVPELLALVDHRDYWVRGQALEVLIMMARDYPSEVDTAGWVDRVAPHMGDRNQNTKDYVGSILRRAGWSAESIREQERELSGGGPEPLDRPKKPRGNRKHRPGGRPLPEPEDDAE